MWTGVMDMSQTMTTCPVTMTATATRTVGSRQADAVGPSSLGPSSNASETASVPGSGRSTIW